MSAEDRFIADKPPTLPQYGEGAVCARPTGLRPRSVRTATAFSALRWWSRVPRPHTFRVLIVLGFVMVAVPLSVGLMLSALEVERLGRQGESVVYEAVQEAQLARVLLQQVNALERSARQYLSLGEQERLRAYEELRGDFRQTLASLSDGHDFEVQHAPGLVELAQSEERLYLSLLPSPGGSVPRELVAAQVTGLVAAVRGLQSHSKRKLDLEVDVMRRMGARAQRQIFWQAVALVPLTVALATIFFLLIARSVRQIDDAVTQLGDGGTQYPIRITGPRDFERLGQRLEWLRLRLRDLEEQKARFLRHVSHELKTPLAALREGADLLADGIVGPLNQAQDEVAGIVRSNTLRLQGLIENLITSSRLRELRTPRLPGEVVILHELVAKVAEDYALSVRRKSLRLGFDLVPTEMIGDRTTLQTVFDNLISNAIKYTPSGGHIELTLRSTRDDAIFEVWDSGPGVAAGEEERIFEAFNQGPEQPPGPVRGTGLGLSIARECVLAHGGEIRLLDAEGRGARFRVTLPLNAGSGTNEA
jgi:two-component system sensor histidine kinase GlrK